MGSSDRAGKGGGDRRPEDSSTSRAAAEEQVVPSGHWLPLKCLLAHGALTCCYRLSPAGVSSHAVPSPAVPSATPPHGPTPF